MTAADRDRLVALVAQIDPCDALEEKHRRQVLDWIASLAPLYRIAKRGCPAQAFGHPFRRDRSGVWARVAGRPRQRRFAPAHGHCEPGKRPWETVQRECPEELGIDTVATAGFGQQPLFVTVTRTRDPHMTGGSYVDVSLWHVVQADPAAITGFDAGEFHGIRWLTPQQVHATPSHLLDPAMHRFTAKYQQRQDHYAASGI